MTYAVDDTRAGLPVPRWGIEEAGTLERVRARMFGGAIIPVEVSRYLLLRPVALSAIGAPYGGHNSPEVQLTKAEGSPHCSLVADCETVSISNAGLAIASGTGVVVLLAGIVIITAPAGIRALRTWTSLVPTPPPLSA